MSTWPFADPQNTAVITVRQVLEDGAWVHYVSHDADDGCWQFMSVEPPRQEDARVVGLGEIVALDPSLRELADLPFGWIAWRNAAEEPWNRKQRA